MHALACPSGVSAVAISVGWSHTCAIVTGGGLLCWGENGYGQLGISSYVRIGGIVDSQNSSAAVGLGSGTHWQCTGPLQRQWLWQSD